MEFHTLYIQLRNIYQVLTQFGPAGPFEQKGTVMKNFLAL